MRTRKPRSVERQENRAEFFGVWNLRRSSRSTALFARERLIRADTAHVVRGFAPFGGATQFERWASSISMRIFFLLITLVSANAVAENVYLFQLLSEPCSLNRTGVEAPVGGERLYQGQVVTVFGLQMCEVIVQKMEFETRFSICMLRGFAPARQLQTASEADITPRGPSCDHRQTYKGDYVFSVGGIQHDACFWTCVTK